MYGVSVFALTVWGIWKAQNSVVFEQRRTEPSLITLRAQSLATKMLEGSQISGGPPQCSNVSEVWTRPLEGTLKLNADAGVFPDGSVGLGFMVWDNGGAMMLAGAKRCWAAWENSTIIEVMAIRRPPECTKGGPSSLLC
ncbi:hypothetical protein ACS0TY_032551 [Phlomoides rotata]